jgi:sterol desaturase/sphingolipid hydroxylase (fatty acid hydroxylase superfamily)
VTTRLFLILFLAIPIVFVLLDGWELWRQRRRGSRETVSAEAVAFIVVVLAVYAAIQLGGFALVPTSDRLMLIVRVAFARAFGRPLSVEPIHGVWLGVFTVALFYVSGLWDYLLHRFFSHSRRFFFTHEYHHLPSHVNLAMPGMAARPFAVLATFPATVATVVSAYALLLLLGLPLWDLSALKSLVLVQALLLTATHSCFMRRWWWTHRTMQRLALTTPQEHLLHHTVDLEGNYGNFTILWDRVFGTYLDPTLERYQGHALGLGYDQDFLGTLTLGRVKLPSALRRRFQVERFCNLEPDRAPNAALDLAATRERDSGP